MVLGLIYAYDRELSVQQPISLISLTYIEQMNEYSCRKKDNQREFSREGSGSKNLVKFLMKIVLPHTSRLPYYVFCICMLTYQKYKSVELVWNTNTNTDTNTHNWEGGREGGGRWEYCKDAASGYKSVTREHKETLSFWSPSPSKIQIQVHVN